MSNIDDAEGVALLTGLSTDTSQVMVSGQTREIDKARNSSYRRVAGEALLPFPIQQQPNVAKYLRHLIQVP